MFSVTINSMTNERPSIKKFFQWCLVALGLYLAFPLYLFVTGFPVWQPGWYVGEKLVERGRSISECMKIISTPSLFGGPMAGEHKQMCVTRYANLNPDSLECNKLPIFYKKICLGRVWVNIFEPIPCLKPDYSNAVTCNDEGSEGYISIENPQTEDCTRYKRNDLRDWCYSIRTIENENIYECEKVKMQSVKDFCEMIQAEKMNSAKICSKISDATRKKYCEIKIDFWLKNPNFRESDYFVKLRKSVQN